MMMLVNRASGIKKSKTVGDASFLAMPNLAHGLLLLFRGSASKGKSMTQANFAARGRKHRVSAKQAGTVERSCASAQILETVPCAPNYHTVLGLTHPQHGPN